MTDQDVQKQINDIWDYMKTQMPNGKTFIDYDFHNHDGVNSPVVSSVSAGVTSLTAGSGITLSASTGNITISNAPFPSPIARDASSSYQDTAATPITFSHTCSGNNRLLVVSVSITGTGDIITGITYGGVAMTRKSSQVNYNASAHSLWFYYLRTPSTGSNTISIAFSGGGSQFVTAFSESYTGVNQNASFPDASDTNSTGAAASLSASPTVVDTNCWLLAAADATGIITAGAGTSLVSTAGFQTGLFDSSQAVGTGLQSLVMNYTGGGAAAISVISIPPSP